MLAMRSSRAPATGSSTTSSIASSISSRTSSRSPIVRSRMDESVALREVNGGAGRACAQILQLLPTWFGIPESNQDYIDTAETHPGVIATVAGEDVGITTVKRHSPYAAEVYLMAVQPSFHRHGIGWQMLARAEQRLAGDGVEFLQVKTLS